MAAGKILYFDSELHEKLTMHIPSKGLPEKQLV
jgi:hypothetical protein